MGQSGVVKAMISGAAALTTYSYRYVLGIWLGYCDLICHKFEMYCERASDDQKRRY
jgi:hypothetical protein